MLFSKVGTFLELMSYSTYSLNNDFKSLLATVDSIKNDDEREVVASLMIRSLS